MELSSAEPTDDSVHILRVGVVEPRYVLYECARPWLIETKRLKPLSAVEKKEKDDVVHLSSELSLPAYYPDFSTAESRADARARRMRGEKKPARTRRGSEEGNTLQPPLPPSGGQNLLRSLEGATTHKGQLPLQYNTQLVGRLVGPIFSAQQEGATGGDLGVKAEVEVGAEEGQREGVEPAEQQQREAVEEERPENIELVFQSESSCMKVFTNFKKPQVVKKQEAAESPSRAEEAGSTQIEQDGTRLLAETEIMEGGDEAGVGAGPGCKQAKASTGEEAPPSFTQDGGNVAHVGFHTPPALRKIPATAQQTKPTTPTVLSSPNQPLMAASPEKSAVLSSPTRSGMSTSHARSTVLSSPQRSDMSTSPAKPTVLSSPPRSAMAVSPIRSTLLSSPTSQHPSAVPSSPAVVSRPQSTVLSVGSGRKVTTTGPQPTVQVVTTAQGVVVESRVYSRQDCTDITLQSSDRPGEMGRAMLRPGVKPDTPLHKPDTRLEKPGTPLQIPDMPLHKPETPSHKPVTPSKKPGIPFPTPSTSAQIPGTILHTPGIPSQLPGTSLHKPGDVHFHQQKPDIAAHGTSIQSAPTQRKSDKKSAKQRGSRPQKSSAPLDLPDPGSAPAASVTPRLAPTPDWSLLAPDEPGTGSKRSHREDVGVEDEEDAGPKRLRYAGPVVTAQLHNQPRVIPGSAVSIPQAGASGLTPTPHHADPLLHSQPHGLPSLGSPPTPVPAAVAFSHPVCSASVIPLVVVSPVGSARRGPVKPRVAASSVVQGQKGPIMSAALSEKTSTDIQTPAAQHLNEAGNNMATHAKTSTSGTSSASIPVKYTSLKSTPVSQEMLPVRIKTEKIESACEQYPSPIVLNVGHSILTTESSDGEEQASKRRIAAFLAQRAEQKSAARRAARRGSSGSESSRVFEPPPPPAVPSPAPVPSTTPSGASTSQPVRVARGKAPAARPVNYGNRGIPEDQAHFISNQVKVEGNVSMYHMTFPKQQFPSLVARGRGSVNMGGQGKYMQITNYSSLESPPETVLLPGAYVDNPQPQAVRRKKSRPRAKPSGAVSKTPELPLSIEGPDADERHHSEASEPAQTHGLLETFTSRSTPLVPDIADSNKFSGLSYIMPTSFTDSPALVESTVQAPESSQFGAISVPSAKSRSSDGKSRSSSQSSAPGTPGSCIRPAGQTKKARLSLSFAGSEDQDSSEDELPSPTTDPAYSVKYEETYSRIFDEFVDNKLETLHIKQKSQATFVTDKDKKVLEILAKYRVLEEVRAENKASDADQGTPTKPKRSPKTVKSPDSQQGGGNVKFPDTPQRARNVKSPDTPQKGRNVKGPDTPQGVGRNVKSPDTPQRARNVKSPDTPQIGRNVKSPDTPQGVGRNVKSPDTPPISRNIKSPDTPQRARNVKSPDTPQIGRNVKSPDTRQGVGRNVTSPDTPQIVRNVKSPDTPQGVGRNGQNFAFKKSDGRTDNPTTTVAPAADPADSLVDWTSSGMRTPGEYKFRGASVPALALRVPTPFVVLRGVQNASLDQTSASTSAAHHTQVSDPAGHHAEGAEDTPTYQTLENVSYTNLENITADNAPSLSNILSGPEPQYETLNAASFHTLEPYMAPGEYETSETSQNPGSDFRLQQTDGPGDDKPPLAKKRRQTGTQDSEPERQAETSSGKTSTQVKPADTTANEQTSPKKSVSVKDLFAVQAKTLEPDQGSGLATGAVATLSTTYPSTNNEQRLKAAIEEGNDPATQEGNNRVSEEGNDRTTEVIDPVSKNGSDRTTEEGSDRVFKKGNDRVAEEGSNPTAEEGNGRVSNEGNDSTTEVSNDRAAGSPEDEGAQVSQELGGEEPQSRDHKRSRRHYEKVIALSRPWKTPEGSVNRPVLRMMLDGVLMHIMSVPGVTLESLIGKYNYILQPVTLLDLLEMLEIIGCIDRSSVVSSLPKASLFSQRSSYDKGGAMEQEGALVFKPTLDCVVKMGQFEAQLSEN